MRISVFFSSGKVDEFNTESFTCAEPFRSEGGAGLNVTTEFSLRLDRLATDGLVLEIYWYDAVVDRYTTRTVDEASGREIYFAGREPGRYVRLISSEELPGIAKICVDGEAVVFRVGDDIINAIKFREQEALCHSDRSGASINSKAMQLYAYLERASPYDTPEEVAQSFGYPYRAFERARQAEAAQIDDIDAEDGETPVGGGRAICPHESV